MSHGYFFVQIEKINLSFKQKRENVLVKSRLVWSGHKDLEKIFFGRDGSSQNSFESMEQVAAYSTEENEQEGLQSSSKKWAADLGLSVRSTLLPLDEVTMNQLVNSCIQVDFMLEGEPAVLASLEIPLHAILEGETEWAGSFALGGFAGADPSPDAEDTTAGLLAWAGSNSSVEVRLLCDNDFADFCVGSCKLELAPNSFVRALPEGWQLKAPADTPPELIHEKVQEMLAGNQGKSQEFTLMFPAQLGEEEPLPIPFTTVAGGALLYDVTELLPDELPQSIDPTPLNTQRSAMTSNVVNPALKKGVWTLVFPQGITVYLSRSQYRQLRKKIKAQSNPMVLPMVLQRKQLKVEIEEVATKGKKPVKGKEVVEEKPLEPLWQCIAFVPLTQFMASPGSLEGEISAEVVSLPAGTSFPDMCLEVSEEMVNQRVAELATAHTSLDIKLRFSPALVPLPPKLETGLSTSDIIQPKSIGPEPVPRDVIAELRTELSDIMSQVAEEYAAMFLVDSHDAPPPSADLREKQFMYGLSTSGVYHLFKERLKPRVQRVVRTRFQSRPQNEHEQDRFLSELYTFLMNEVNHILHKRVVEAETKEQIESEPTNPQASEDEDSPAGKASKESVHLLSLCNDAEASMDLVLAHRRHEDRVNAMTRHAEKHDGGSQLLKQAWFQYAEFCLRKIDDFNVDKAGQCLREVLALDSKDEAALALYGAFLMDQGQNEKAETFLLAARDMKLPPLDPGEIEHDEDILAANVGVRLHGLLCMHWSLAGQGRKARESLRHGVLSLLKSGYKEPATQANTPRRTAVKLAQDLAEYFLQYNLLTCAENVLQLAKSSENLAVEKARERQLPTHCSKQQRERTLRLDSQLSLAKGDMDGAESLAVLATELDSSSGLAWFCLGEAQYARGQGTVACESYTKALHLLDPSRGKPQPLGKDGAKLSRAQIGQAQKSTPLHLFLRLGTLYRQLSKLEESREVFLRSCQVWNSPSSWLGAGIACLRLNQLLDAEEALQQANLLDHQNGMIWGYLSLLSLMSGEERLEHANKSLEQALRFQIMDPVLLRELGIAYMAIDRLEVAESLLRQSLALERNPRTQRVLADVNATQNMGTAAVEDYKAVIFNPSADEEEKQQAFSKCIALLKKLGREDEIQAISI